MNYSFIERFDGIESGTMDNRIGKKCRNYRNCDVISQPKVGGFAPPFSALHTVSAYLFSFLVCRSSVHNIKLRCRCVIPEPIAINERARTTDTQPITRTRYPSITHIFYCDEL